MNLNIEPKYKNSIKIDTTILNKHIFYDRIYNEIINFLDNRFYYNYTDYCSTSPDIRIDNPEQILKIIDNYLTDDVQFILVNDSFHNFYESLDDGFMGIKNTNSFDYIMGLSHILGEYNGIKIFIDMGDLYIPRNTLTIRIIRNVELYLSKPVYEGNILNLSYHYGSNSNLLGDILCFHFSYEKYLLLNEANNE